VLRQAAGRAAMVQMCSGMLQEGPQWYSCAQAGRRKGRNGRAVLRHAAGKAAMVEQCSRLQEGPRW